MNSVIIERSLNRQISPNLDNSVFLHDQAEARLRLGLRGARRRRRMCRTPRGRRPSRLLLPWRGRCRRLADSARGGQPSSRLLLLLHCTTTGIARAIRRRRSARCARVPSR